MPTNLRWLKPNTAKAPQSYLRSGHSFSSSARLREVLKSKSITVTAMTDKGAEVGVDFPAIQQVVGAKVGVASKSASNATLTYTGSELLTFGFKCFGIAFADGEWNVFSTPPAAELAFDAVGGSGTLLGSGRLVIR